MRKLLSGLKLTRDLVEPQPAMCWITGANLSPTGHDARRWLPSAESSIDHAVGMCRMETDDMSVVDPDHGVHGVDGLRITDASMMPTIISGNTNALTMMIAPRAVEFIFGAASVH